MRGKPFTLVLDMHQTYDRVEYLGNGKHQAAKRCSGTDGVVFSVRGRVGVYEGYIRNYLLPLCVLDVLWGISVRCLCLLRLGTYPY